MAEFDFSGLGLEDGSFADLGSEMLMFSDAFVKSGEMLPKTETSPFHESDSGVSEGGSESLSPTSSADVVESLSPSCVGGDLDPWFSEMLETNPTGLCQTSSPEKHDDPVMCHQGRADVSQVSPARLFDFENWSDLHGELGDLQGEVSAETEPASFTHDPVSFTHDPVGLPHLSAQKCREARSRGVGTVESTAPGTRRRRPYQKATAQQRTRRRRFSEEEEEEECDEDTDVVHTHNPRGTVRVKKVGERLPTSKCNVTSVKVLRIVNSNGGGVDDGEEGEVVARALEERNRKNAEMARQNRQKKKEYVEGLEREVGEGRKRIGKLQECLKEAEEEREGLRREVDYLKAVLANQSALASLLTSLPGSVGGVSLSSSLSRKRGAELDHSYTPLKKSRPSSGVGVCLHVRGNSSASLEFCQHCSHMASGQS